jgi:hypothetical protein
MPTVTHITDSSISLSAQRWDSVYSTFQNSSASSIVAGGNTRTANITIGTNDAFNLRLETNNTTRINILSSGFVGIGTANNDSRVTERLTVSGNISATGVVYAQEGNSTQWNLASNTAINYTHANFLPLTGGIISGETRINNNLTVFGNLTATGTTTFANTVFSTTSALSVVHIGSGPAMWVGNNGDGDIASFYDIDSNVEVLHVGGNTGSFPNVGVKTSTPNKDFTVNGEISASNTIYDNVGNSNQWNTAYQNVSSQSLNKTDKVNFNELGVGTNNPLYFNLDVNGQSGNGTIGNSYGDLGLGATGSINIYPNNYLVLSPVNNIIVRPSSDTTTLPNERFTVVGNISSSNVIHDSAGNSTQWNSVYSTFQNSSAFSIVAGGNTRNANITIGTNDAYHLRFETNNSAKMTVLSGGEVGIGTTLTETLASGSGGLIVKNNLLVGGNLTVNGNVSANNIDTWASYNNNDGGPIINVNKITISDGQSPNFVQITDVGIVFFNSTGINTAANTRNNLGLGTAATLNSDSFALSGGNTNGSNLLIGTNDNFNLNLATANTTRMTITSTGNVGINTTTPNERLTVVGNISATGTIFNANRRVVTTNTTTVPGISAVTGILAVSALPVVQETGVLYILI